MDPKKYKADVKAWKKRWEAVNEFEKEELRRTPLETKLQQFFAMRAWVKGFGWEKALEEGVEEVRQRWVRLRRGLNG